MSIRATQPEHTPLLRHLTTETLTVNLDMHPISLLFFLRFMQEPEHVALLQEIAQILNLEVAEIQPLQLQSVNTNNGHIRFSLYAEQTAPEQQLFASSLPAYYLDVQKWEHRYAQKQEKAEQARNNAFIDETLQKLRYYTPQWITDNSTMDTTTAGNTGYTILPPVMPAQHTNPYPPQPNYALPWTGPETPAELEQTPEKATSALSLLNAPRTACSDNTYIIFRTDIDTFHIYAVEDVTESALYYASNEEELRAWFQARADDAFHAMLREGRSNVCSNLDTETWTKSDYY